MNILDYDFCVFSSNGQYLAAALGYNLLIIKSPFVNPCITTKASYIIDGLQWNCECNRLLCSQLKNNSLQIYDLHSKMWTHKIRCGFFKFIDSNWIGSDKILITLEYFMALAVLNLRDCSVFYIEVPKPIQPCIAFNSSGKTMFVITKINGFEKLLMLNLKKIKRILYLQDFIGHCNGIYKSPKENYLCIFNNKNLAIICFLTGDIIDSTNDFNVTFKLHHCINREYNFDYYKEYSGDLIKINSMYIYPKENLTNISLIRWSFCGKYLCTLGDDLCLHIWKKTKLICIVEFSSNVKQVSWSHSEIKLCAVFGTQSIFLWTDQNCPILKKLPNFTSGNRMLATNISWSYNNKYVILVKSHFRISHKVTLLNNL
ncbi:uncharacterized protein LOC126902395 isoform X2 [Daktulosphaira vitifoliae]|uniref:uncharacterized protein LOC126902395 isoform X2 n=1 Tax=Daktulosphaira vitifoliae TaxID=58002 RepID=UPI0021A9CFAC|nr:uncharacterized protein LOC126902395 isoform X2 [Daktulosphaira vitifoliae]